MERFGIAQAAAASVLPCCPGKQITGRVMIRGGEEMEEVEEIQDERRWRRGDGDGCSHMQASCSDLV